MWRIYLYLKNISRTWTFWAKDLRREDSTYKYTFLYTYKYISCLLVYLFTPQLFVIIFTYTAWQLARLFEIIFRCLILYIPEKLVVNNFIHRRIFRFCSGEVPKIYGGGGNWALSNNLQQPCWYYQTCSKVVPTSPIQSWYNNIVTTLCGQPCNMLVIPWLYHTC
jgi:hypothetical protein